MCLPPTNDQEEQFLGYLVIFRKVCFRTLSQIGPMAIASSPAWFIAAATYLRGKHRLSEALEVVEDPEEIRGAKEWLSSRMPRNQPYAETLDQPALSELFDLQSARRARSFDKCYREIVGLLHNLRAKTV